MNAVCLYRTVIAGPLRWTSDSMWIQFYNVNVKVNEQKPELTIQTKQEVTHGQIINSDSIRNV